MSHCVLDGSVALAWVLPGEGEGAGNALLERVAESGASVPALWPFEVANALLVAERRARITPEEQGRALALLGDLPIDVNAPALARCWGETLLLARTHRLTAYEASNLELALRRRLPLATHDRALRAAAEACGVELPI